MAEYVLSEEEAQAVQEGEAADLLLDHPAFLLAIEKIRKDCAEAILTSNPQEAAQREDLYHLSRGLSAVTEQLTNMSAVSKSILENAELQQTLDDDAQA